MSYALDDDARAWGRLLEDREAARSGALLRHARAALARRTGIPAGTLENLRRGRLKGVRAWVLDRLRAAMIAELEAELRRVAYELDVVAKGGRGLGEGAMEALERSRAELAGVIRDARP